MRTVSRLTLAAATAGLILSFAVVVPANAINRVRCGPDFLQLFSRNTTCWANAGTASVRLYGVTGLSSGNNAGYVKGPSIRANFDKDASTGWPGSYTIETIHIK